MRSLVTAASAAVLLLAVAGCGGGSQAANAPQGEPLVLGIVNTDSSAGSLKSTGDGLEAWVKAQNAKGGVQGRPLEVSRCDDAGDPQKNADCARRMVADPKVLVIAGSAGRHLGATSGPIFEAASMPVICASPSSVQEFSGKTAFCIRGGHLVGFASVLDYWKKNNINTVTYVAQDTAAGHSSANDLKTLQSIVGTTPAGESYVPQNSPDFLPAAQAAEASDPNAILLGMAPNVTLQMLQAFQTVGSKPTLGTNGGSLNGAVISSPASEGLYADNSFPVFSSTDPAMTEFKNGMGEAGFDKEIDGYALAGWLTGKVFENVANQVGPNPTRESILKVLMDGKVENVPLLPAVLSRANAPKSIPNLGAIANPTTHVVQIKNGELTDLGTFTMP
ncbi:ABC transporter substrate-binding protein [Pseudonocardia xishanensis]|uniref:Leucine-binding protein domain-containing protein n=1 Tax=Pseudonocardia xishanensis TaxID=630995 RepID=A0ABP8RZD0_9PSEU